MLIWAGHFFLNRKQILYIIFQTNSSKVIILRDFIRCQRIINNVTNSFIFYMHVGDKNSRWNISFRKIYVNNVKSKFFKFTV